MQPMDEKQRFYTPQELAEMLGVHLQTVRKWYRSGKLGHYKLGHRDVRISQEQLDNFMKAREKQGEQP